MFGQKCKSRIRDIQLCNESRFKRSTEVDKFNFQAKSDLASLQAEADKTDIDKINIFLLI